MNTPIVDFVKKYNESNTIRMHMPGHKGAAFLGLESFDITEVEGADSLYHAKGIIDESERNATKLFNTGKTVYSTEGSSICIKTMLHLAILNWQSLTKESSNKRPVVIAARNAHLSFMHAAMLLDFDVKWIWPQGEDYNLLSCSINIDNLEREIINAGESLACVYITSPDYLGNMANVEEIASLCHRNNTMLLVDNAHGAYLAFLDKHPIKAGADMCCDSAHKTLPVLTGGAYLHMNKGFNQDMYSKVKNVMNIYGSTSPSYLILQSLDMCNEYIENDFSRKADNLIKQIDKLKEYIRNTGFNVLETDPFKITINTVNGFDLAKHLRRMNIECEYVDQDFVVMMLTPENVNSDLQRLKNAIDEYTFKHNDLSEINQYEYIKEPESVMTIRQAMMSESERVNAENALGRICASPVVSCPPAIPVVVSGEVIDQFAIKTLTRYNIRVVDCVVNTH